MDGFLGVSLGAAAAILQVAGYLIYIRLFLKGEIKPNAASWLMFAYGTGLLAFLEFQNAASLSLLALPVACAFMSIFVAFLCLRRGATYPVDRVEVFVFSTDFWLTIFYLSLSYLVARAALPPALDAGFLVAVNATAITCFIPIIRSTWQSPEREEARPWAVWTAAYVCLAFATVLGADWQNPVLYVYPMANAALHGAVFLLSLRKYGSGDVFKDGDGQHVFTGRSRIHGYGMFAGRAYGQGEEIWRLTGRPMIGSASEADPDAIGFAYNFWIEPDAPFDCLNHSCDSNAAFGRAGQFFALRPIAKGDEILMDYSTTEADPEWRMQCACGSANCRKQLRAIQIAFADSSFPPPASPGMQLIWRDYRVPVGGELRPAFPQLFENEDRREEADIVPIREAN